MGKNFVTTPTQKNELNAKNHKQTILWNEKNEGQSSPVPNIETDLI